MISRDQIMASPDTPAVEVHVPEWGGTVRVRTMSGIDRDRFERLVSEQSKTGEIGKNVRAWLVAICAVDESGARLFSDADAEELGKKSWIPLDRVATEAIKLNKLDDSAVEELVKN